MLSSTVGRFVYVLFFAAISIGCEKTYVSAPQSKPSSSVSEPDELKTTRYIEMLDPRVFELRGVRSLSLMYSPERVPEGEHPDHWYDYSRLRAVDEKLRGIDRNRALAALYSKIVPSGVEGETAVSLVHGFVSRSIVHFLQPQNENRDLILDPLLILELGEGRCGQKARLVVDIMRAGGYEARLVQLGGHVASEVRVQEKWVYVDPDIFVNGDLPKKDGHLLSAAELSRLPEVMDALPSYIATSPGFNGTSVRPAYPSFVFNESSYLGYWPMYYQRNDIGFYGLSYSDAVLDRLVIDSASDIAVVKDRVVRHVPWTPFFTDVVLSADEVRLKWISFWKDEKPIYRVYISRQSRGWNYPPSYFPDVQSFMRFTTPSPESFKKRTVVPPSEVGLMLTSEAEISIPRDPTDALYITVDATDSYGRSIGRAIFSPSQEIVVPAVAGGN